MNVITTKKPLYCSDSLKKLKVFERYGENANLKPVKALLEAIRYVQNKAIYLDKSGDEECAYVMLGKYFALIDLIRQKKDFKKFKEVASEYYGTFGDLMSNLNLYENLQISLVKRYSGESEDIEKIAATFAVDIPEVLQKYAIDASELVKRMRNSSMDNENILLIDCRIRNDFNNHRINYPNLVNIPKDEIMQKYEARTKHVTAQNTNVDFNLFTANLEFDVLPEHKKIWNSRGSMDLIVIIPDDYLVPIDEDVEEEDLFDNEDPTTILYLSLTKYDLLARDKDVRLLYGGYNFFKEMFADWIDKTVKLKDSKFQRKSAFGDNVKREFLTDTIKIRADVNVEKLLDADNKLKILNHTVVLFEDWWYFHKMTYTTLMDLYLVLEEISALKNIDLRIDLFTQRLRLESEYSFQEIEGDRLQLEVGMVSQHPNWKSLINDNDNEKYKNFLDYINDLTKKLQKDINALKKKTENKQMMVYEKQREYFKLHSELNDIIGPLPAGAQRDQIIPFSNNLAEVRAIIEKYAIKGLQSNRTFNFGLTSLVNVKDGKKDLSFVSAIIKCMLNIAPVRGYLKQHSKVNRESEESTDIVISLAKLSTFIWSSEFKSISPQAFIDIAAPSMDSLLQVNSCLFVEEVEDFRNIGIKFYEDLLSHLRIGPVDRSNKIPTCPKAIDLNTKLPLKDQAKTHWHAYCYGENWDDAIIDMFMIQIQKTTTCEENCGYRHIHYDHFQSLSLQANEDCYDLNDCLNNYFKDEVVDGNCKVCQTKKPLRIRRRISRLPTALVLHLDRNTSYIPKITFPLEHLELIHLVTIDLSNKMEHEYNLNAVSNRNKQHHYTAFCKHISHKWYEHNGIRITPIRENDVMSPNSVTLFYVINIY